MLPRWRFDVDQESNPGRRIRNRRTMKRKNGGGDRVWIRVRVTGGRKKKKVQAEDTSWALFVLCIVYRVCKVRACVASEPGYEPNTVKNMRSRVRHPSGKSS